MITCQMIHKTYAAGHGERKVLRGLDFADRKSVV